MNRWFGVLVLVLCTGCEKAQTTHLRDAPRPQQGTQEADPSERLKRAEELLQKSQYRAAQEVFETLLKTPVRARAALGLSQAFRLTGRYDLALKFARTAADADEEVAPAAAVLQARAHRSAGDLSAARAALEPVVQPREALQARLLLGEILLEQGKRDEAEPLLMALIEQYNAERIEESDGPGLAMVGRAAHLLRSPHDANDAFNMAERAVQGHVQTLLWRAELFLEKHDPGHAEEVVREVLKNAPKHPDALVWLAHVRLAQALDFDEAERLAREALEVNPKHVGAHVVLAGVALRDMELELAAQRVEAGLGYRPGDLQLMSMRAAVHFLADDQAAFQATTKAVLQQNPQYSKVYQIVGEYAEWEHRYEDIVEMMEEAVRIDPGDAHAHASLGLNLIRAGQDDAGIISLRTAFELDPFNVRVFNTLNLYEKTIKADYVSVSRGRFRIRYPKSEMALLDRYVPELLERAFGAMVERYGFEPETPIYIELYQSREDFSIRTSGLPRTAIQGVCFGRTLASMSLGAEKFNLGMTLWHELAHVFHIQLSNYRVPRWFTEGLAEYETMIARAEWSREHDPDLFEALRSQRVPQVADMSRAFTRAEQMSDIATAYYASSKILAMLAEQHGMDKLRSMLKQWGEGKRSEAVIQDVLGVEATFLDEQFKKHSRDGLRRYNPQFVPILRAEPLDKLRALLEDAPEETNLQLRLAVSAWRHGQPKLAEKVLGELSTSARELPDALYLSGRLAIEQGQGKRARQHALRLLEAGHDGYWTQLLLAEAWLLQEQPGKAEAALRSASRFDPTQSEPLTMLYRVQRSKGKHEAELPVLTKLAKLEQHSGTLYARLLHLLVEQEEHQRAVKLGEAALWADLSSFDIHYWLAMALRQTGDEKRALFELESAVLCDAPKERKVQGHLELIKSYRKQGRPEQAREQAEQLRGLDPENAELRRLGL